MITYKERDQRGLPSTLEVPGYSLHKTINGLPKGKTYDIQISAATVKGKGRQSPLVTGTVLIQPTNSKKA